jgi:hypothetical protein
MGRVTQKFPRHESDVRHTPRGLGAKIDYRHSAEMRLPSWAEHLLGDCMSSPAGVVAHAWRGDPMNQTKGLRRGKHCPTSGPQPTDYFFRRMRYTAILLRLVRHALYARRW